MTIAGTMRDAGQQVRRQFLLDRVRLTLASGLQFETPGAESIGAQQELRSHLLQVLDAQCRNCVEQLRNIRRLKGLNQQVPIVFRRTIQTLRV